jgi:acyl-coenzyme A synthetase/AMP-(fatty) acid ligase/acyl carrier protein
LGCHKGLSHFIQWQRQTFAIGPPDRGAQLTGLSFDVVLRDIFLPLSSGATLCLPTAEDELGPERILGWLERERITLLHTVPSLAQSWLVRLPPGIALPALRWVFMAGEPLTGSLVRRWREAFQGTGQIVNLYGPTETTLAKCFYLLPPDIPAGVQPVGRPLPETQALVLSEHNQCCGVGEPGEIVLRTPFRTLGYINAPAENRQRFVKNPFRNDARDLLYHTGDAGRYRPDGSLEILGRLDFQIKIRGIRIEPGEIEALLSQHPAIWQSVVVAHQEPAGDKRLVAYLVPRPGQVPTPAELRHFLAEKLPEAMIPSTFVKLTALPLTPNGKVNRQALPAPDRIAPEQARTFVAPRNPTEEALAEIWAGILGLAQVGALDNFFELGGHSLLATQVISRLRDIFRVNLPVRSLFESPTIATLAQHLETLQWASQNQPLSTNFLKAEREEGEL